MSDIVNDFKPTYKIRSLSLVCIRDKLNNGDLKHLKNNNYFDLHKLDISFCSQINDSSFEYFKNVKKLEMVACDQNTITNQGLSQLKQLRELNMTACNQDTITNQVFQSMNTDEFKIKYQSLLSIH